MSQSKPVPAKGPTYPFTWPATKPSRETRKPKRRWKRKAATTAACAHWILTVIESCGHTGHAFGASKAGRGNPSEHRRTKRHSRALFLCPVLLNGGWYGAGFGLAGSYVPVFHPRISRRLSAVESGRDGSNHQHRSQS